jgi:hypothetical protein
MQGLSQAIIDFLQLQSFVIISTLDAQGNIHCAAKGVVSIDKEGKVCLIDLYRGNTFTNLKQSPIASITAIDEYKFCGYTLKGKAKIVEREDFDDTLIKAWEEKVVQRISNRVIKSVQREKEAAHHPEVHLPPVQYVIALSVDEIVDLTPAHIKKKKP